MYCFNCGKEVVKNSKFCKHCGYPLQEGELNNNHNIEKEGAKASNEEVINLLVQEGLTNNEAEKLIQRTDANENLECISIEEIKKEEKNQKNTANLIKDNSIGGWLILFGIGLLFGIFRSIAELSIYRSDEVSNGFLAIFVSGKGLEYITKMDIAIILTIVSIFFLILTFSHFVRRSVLTKNLFFFTSILNIVISIYLLFILQKEANTEDFKDLIVISISFILWGTYFILSKRVKGTFTVKQTTKSNMIKVMVSVVLPMILFYQYNDFKSEIKSRVNIQIENEKKEFKKNLSMNYYANFFMNKVSFLKMMSDSKSSVIKSEINTFKRDYSLKDNRIKGEENTLDYVDKTFNYSKLIKAVLYYCGNECSDIEQNLEKSYTYFESINTKSINLFKLLMLAEMNFYGIGVPQNLNKAVHYASLVESTNEYSKSIKKLYMGWGYLFGEKYEKNIDKAILFLNESNNISAVYVSAIIMATQSNFYTEDDIVNQFKKATNLGNPSSQMMLGLYYINKNKKEKGMKVLEECSKSNNNCKNLFQKLLKIG